MSLSSSLKATSHGDVQPRDPEHRQNLVTVPHSYDTEWANKLRTNSKETVYPVGAITAYDLGRGELAYGRKPRFNVSTMTAIATSSAKRARIGVSATNFAIQGVTNQVSEHEQPGLTSLAGWHLETTSLSDLSDEEVRNAIMNQLHVLGFVDKAFTSDDGKAGRIYQTCVAGTIYAFADYDMPVNALVEVTAPLPSELRAGRFKRAGYAGKPTLITRPVRPTSFAIAFTTNVNWFLRSPEQFKRAMDPHIKETHTWIAIIQELVAHTTNAALTYLDLIMRQHGMPMWPMKRTAAGALEELADGDDYSRAANQSAHMFYAAVGFREGARGDAAPVAPVANFAGSNSVAGKMKELRRRLREEPVALAEAFAIATGHVTMATSGAIFSAGRAAEPVATIDPMTLKFYDDANSTFNPRYTGTDPKQAALAFRHAHAKMVFYNGVDRNFALGSLRDASNRFLTTSGEIVSNSVGAKMVGKQGDSFFRFAALLSEAHKISSSNIIGRVTKAGPRESHYTINMSKCT